MSFDKLMNAHNKSTEGSQNSEIALNSSVSSFDYILFLTFSVISTEAAGCKSQMMILNNSPKFWPLFSPALCESRVGVT